MKWRFTCTYSQYTGIQYNEKMERWMTKSIFLQVLHDIKSVASVKFDGSYTIFFDNCTEIMKQLELKF